MTSRIVVYGNAGSGKTTMAKGLGLPHLDLDTIAWKEGTEREDLAESVAALRAFTESHESWVVEGCYGDLVEAALPFCTELRFLNPGVEACVANCRRRPHEPHKFATPKEQDDALAFLIGWVRQYETRTDEFGLLRHRAIYEGFRGRKREYR